MKYLILFLSVFVIEAPSVVNASNEVETTESLSALNSEPAFYRGNKSWGGGKQKWSGKSKKMTLSELKKAKEECKKSKNEGCYIGYESFRKNNSGNHGWHCGSRKSGPDNKFLSPIDYACWKHDREKYNHCGLHHALYCRWVNKKGSDSVLKDLNRIYADFVNYQGIKCYGKNYPIFKSTYKDMPKCNNPRN